MGWTSQQSARLRLEMEITSRYFPSFHLNDSIIPSHAVVEGTMRSNSGAEYLIRLHVPADLPNSVPLLEIVSPVLRDRFGHSLVDLGTSYPMHLLKPESGYVRICHYSASHWSPNITFSKVLLKIRAWIEAYEGHLDSGFPIDHFLPHMEA
jgi:ubiquitin-protein ligase